MKIDLNKLLGVIEQTTTDIKEAAKNPIAGAKYLSKFNEDFNNFKNIDFHATPITEEERPQAEAVNLALINLGTVITNIRKANPALAQFLPMPIDNYLGDLDRVKTALEEELKQVNRKTRKDI